MIKIASTNQKRKSDWSIVRLFRRIAHWSHSLKWRIESEKLQNHGFRVVRRQKITYGKWNKVILDKIELILGQKGHFNTWINFQNVIFVGFFIKNFIIALFFMFRKLSAFVLEKKNVSSRNLLFETAYQREKWIIWIFGISSNVYRFWISGVSWNNRDASLDEDLVGLVHVTSTGVWLGP